MPPGVQLKPTRANIMGSGVCEPSGGLTLECVGHV